MFIITIILTKSLPFPNFGHFVVITCHFDTFVFLNYFHYICTVKKSKTMGTFLKGLLIGLGSIFLIGFVALFSGTLVYWLWPIAIPAALPGLVENGVLTSEIMWWPAVALTWLCGILIKSTQTNNNNCK